eukprot:TRINITY_DN1181_c0_g1::TRINITY_DN1181_c0_g1_i1::g.17267::m.17267 TRINITY_DN1181_c0_g1::TRINITY_DN1181_c0_g1_i1::g.17267  ORF type:complete len:1164 (-),score=310.45,sp/P48053/YPD1_CAEEL/31.93/2e-112,sp/P48053/YPD1_CAEEL/26.11/5e-15,Peptidase_M16_C/PF05193.16/1.7e-15,Peptidase_M16_C/PF05193.16/29,Peptidase_M16_C/PF05193.16/3.4e+03,Peptidase_M16/PF00675.15/7.9e-09 TRINITY_DN1181_c0_g1_i1:232-3723(-)
MWEENINFVSSTGVPIKKYRSTETGLSVVLAEVQGPLVNGYFILSTEAHDDDGCPHTLEHLIFLGSEKYPYKGVLDMLANRCLSQGTNAWTDTDHTAYTMSTAGQEGFLNLLPVFLDHILYPTLTDSGFVTEVHHITPEGDNAGVVYCEMQARENTSSSKSYRQILKRLYPGESGYNCETGGMLANLRALTVEKVREYHKQFYRPDNLCVLIVGQVDPNAVFDTLKAVEDSIKQKGSLPPMVRPWSDAVPELTQTTVDVVTFPSDEEESGDVLVGWRSEEFGDWKLYAALRAMQAYLTQGPVSPLQTAFVHRPDPFCNSVGFSNIENKSAAQILHLSGTITEKMDLVMPQLKDALKSVLEQGVDLARMKDVLSQLRAKQLLAMEEDPHDTLSFLTVGHFLYGSSEQQLKDAVDIADIYDSLQGESSEFWKTILSQYYIERPSAAVISKPSELLAQESQVLEKLRVDAQKLALGKNRLEELASLLESSAAANSVEAPHELLVSFAVPDASKIPFIPVASVQYVPPYLNREGASSAESGGGMLGAMAANTSTSASHGVWKCVPGSAADPTPLLDRMLGRNQGHATHKHLDEPRVFLHFTHVASKFADVTAYMDIDVVPLPLRPYIELFLEAAFELDVEKDDGSIMPLEEVVRALEAETVSHSSSLGFDGTRNFECGLFGNLAQVSVKCEGARYMRAVQWVRDILWRTRLDAAHLKVAASKLLNDVGRAKRDGFLMARSMLRTCCFKPESCFGVTNVFKQQAFLTEVLRRLDAEPEAVLSELSQFRSHLTAPENVKVHIACNLMATPSLIDPFLKAFAPRSPTSLSPHTLFATSTLINTHSTAPNTTNTLSSSSSSHPTSSLLTPNMASNMLNMGVSGQSVGTSMGTTGAAGNVNSGNNGSSTSVATSPVMTARRKTDFMIANVTANSRLPVTPSSALLKLVDGKLAPEANILALGSVESSFLVQGCVGVNHFEPAELAALYMAIDILVATEGPFWRQIRGQGLSYSYGLRLDPEIGMLFFVLARSAQLVRAYQESKKIIDDYLHPDMEITQHDLDAARSQAIFSIIDRERTVPMTSKQAFLHYLRGADSSYHVRLLRELQAVTPDIIKQTMKTFFTPLFNPNSSALSIVTNPAKVEEVLGSFKGFGFEQVRDVGAPEAYFTSVLC